MSIVRALHNKINPYVQINREALWDRSLSLKAIGLWARLLSRPDDWRVSVTELAKSCKCSKDSIYKLLNELIKQGYAYRRQPKNAKGKYGQWETIVFEFKVTKDEIKKMFPQTDFPDPDSTVTGKAETTKELKTKEESYKALPSSSSSHELRSRSSSSSPPKSGADSLKTKTKNATQCTDEEYEESLARLKKRIKELPQKEVGNAQKWLEADITSRRETREPETTPDEMYSPGLQFNPEFPNIGYRAGAWMTDEDTTTNAKASDDLNEYATKPQEMAAKGRSLPR